MTDTLSERTLKSAIRDIPDFPKKGVIFKDITPLLGNGKLFHTVMLQMAEPFKKHKIQKVAAIESRGFIFGAAIADILQAGYVPIRKSGKLPYETVSESYSLEYGDDKLEMHSDAITKGEKVLIVDDVLATGGTAGATCRLVEKLAGDLIGLSFLIELTFLNGKSKLKNRNIRSLIKY